MAFLRIRCVETVSVCAVDNVHVHRGQDLIMAQPIGYIGVITVCHNFIPARNTNNVKCTRWVFVKNLIEKFADLFVGKLRLDVKIDPASPNKSSEEKIVFSV